MVQNGYLLPTQHALCTNREEMPWHSIRMQEISRIHLATETDYKPLLGIIKKSLSEMTHRLKRLMLRIRRYEMDFQNILGKSLILADAFSRGKPHEMKSDTEQEI